MAGCSPLGQADYKGVADTQILFFGVSCYRTWLTHRGGCLTCNGEIATLLYASSTLYVSYSIRPFYSHAPLSPLCAILRSSSLSIAFAKMERISFLNAEMEPYAEGRGGLVAD